MKNVPAELDMAGQLLLIAAFMLGNGLSLVLFPQVRFQHNSTLHITLTDTFCKVDFCCDVFRW